MIMVDTICAVLVVFIRGFSVSFHSSYVTVTAATVTTTVPILCVQLDILHT